MRCIAALAAFVFLAAPAVAEESWHGRWAVDPTGCTIDGDTAETAPLIATAHSLRWFVTHCQIRRVYKTDAGVHIQARCSNEGTVNMTPVTLKPQGDRMRVTWNRGAAMEMRRCR